MLAVIYIVYDFRLTGAVFAQDGARAMHALGVLAYMRGGVLVLGGLALVAAAGVEYWRDGQMGGAGKAVEWTGQDTGEVVLGVIGVIWGGVVMGWRRFALV